MRKREWEGNCHYYTHHTYMYECNQLFRIHHQKSRYVYELFYKRKAISRGKQLCSVQ